MPDLLNQLLGLASPWPSIFAFDFGRYLVAATTVSGVLLISAPELLGSRRVQRRRSQPRQRWHEFRHSLSAAVVFSLVGLGVYYGAARGIFRIHPDLREYGWAYWGLSLVFIVVSHDAYFYWAHRWMHSPGVFRRVHGTHHRSVAPTQWAAYSFSLSEALIQAAFLPLVLLIVPVHLSVLFLWMAHQVFRNVVGHCGVELVPRRWLAGWWGRWLTTTLHHDMHHEHGRYNYGLYFAWWDRWCVTEHPAYRERLADLVARMQGASELQSQQSET
jgi:sterol desaturase/sphingolipid hydroxylase (fatty acid hydroxylase superfamily)